MSNQNDYQAQLESIRTIADEDVMYPNMPVDTYLQEAENLYQWVKDDKEAFESIGFDWTIVEEIPVRAGALREAESIWAKELNSRQEAEQRWNDESPDAYDLRDQLLHTFRYAYRKNPELLTNVSEIAEGASHSDMIQDLNDLAVLGKANTAELEAINFDFTLLDKAASTADQMAEVLAMANGDRAKDSEYKEVRDKAYTHLKEVVDEVKECGKYLFWRDEDRLQGYTSAYYKKLRN